MGWHHQPPVIALVREMLAQHPDSFIDVRWLSLSVGASVETPTSRFGPLNMRRSVGEIEFVDGTAIIATNPAALTTASWTSAVESVFNAIGVGSTLYLALTAKIGNGLSETSVKTALQRLIDQRRITADGDPSDWNAMSFSRRARAAD
jgi:hypothetical protein